MQYKELNPIHSTETESIIKKFEVTLTKWNSKETTNNYNNEVSSSFKTVYNNATSEYEDNSDSYRIKFRRSISFATIALQCDSNNGFTFIEYAKFSLEDKYGLENKYLGLLLIELMFNIENESLYKDSSDEIEQFLLVYKEKIEKTLLGDTEKLLEDCELFIH